MRCSSALKKKSKTSSRQLRNKCKLLSIFKYFFNFAYVAATAAVEVMPHNLQQKIVKLCLFNL